MPLEKQAIRKIKTTFDVAFKDFLKYDQYAITEDRISLTFKNEELAGSFCETLNAELSNAAGMTLFVPNVLNAHIIESDISGLNAEQLTSWMEVLTHAEILKTLVVRDVIKNIQKGDRLSLLCRMVYGPEYEKVIRDEQGIPALVALLLNSNSLSEKDQNSICFALSRMSQFDVKNQDAIREAGGIPILLELLTQRLDKKVDSRQFIDTLVALMRNNPANQKVIQAMPEGVSFLMNLLEHQDPAIQQSAAMLLSEIAHTYQDAIREQEGIPLLLSFLELDAATPITQSWVAKALVEMLLDNAENQRIVFEKGDMDLLLPLLDSDKDEMALFVRLLQNGGNRGMQEWSLKTLVAVLNGDENTGDLLAEVGGIQQCLNLLQDVNTPTDLTPMIMDILYHMDSIDDQKILQNADGVAILQQWVINRNDNTSKESSQAMHILCQMACEPIFQETIRETEGVVELLLDFAHASDISTQRSAINALHVMSVNIDNQLVIQEVGGIPVFIQLLNSGDRKVQSSATAAIARMTSTFLNQKDLQGAILPLVTLLKNDAVDDETKAAASSSLIILACNPMNQDAFREANGIELLTDLLVSHKDNPEMQEWVAQALYVLTLGNNQNKNVAFKKDLAVPEKKDSLIFGLLRSAQSMYQTIEQNLAFAAERLKTVSNNSNNSGPKNNLSDTASVASTEAGSEFYFDQQDEREPTPNIFQPNNAVLKSLNSDNNTLPKNVTSTPSKQTLMQGLQAATTPKSPVKALKSSGVTIAPEKVDVEKIREIILLAIKKCMGANLQSESLQTLFSQFEFHKGFSEKDKMPKFSNILILYLSNLDYSHKEKDMLRNELMKNNDFKRAFNFDVKVQSPQKLSRANSNASNATVSAQDSSNHRLNF